MFEGQQRNKPKITKTEQRTKTTKRQTSLFCVHTRGTVEAEWDGKGLKMATGGGIDASLEQSWRLSLMCAYAVFFCQAKRTKLNLVSYKTKDSECSSRLSSKQVQSCEAVGGVGSLQTWDVKGSALWLYLGSPSRHCYQTKGVTPPDGQTKDKHLRAHAISPSSHHKPLVLDLPCLRDAAGFEGTASRYSTCKANNLPNVNCRL